MAYCYALVMVARGRERERRYASAEPLSPGDVVRAAGRDWLVESVDDDGRGPVRRARAWPARYRLRLRHDDGREELCAFRRYRPDAPRFGHTFTTEEDGQPVAWLVVDQRLARDGDGVPYLDLLAVRGYDEFEEIPDHELEHVLARGEPDLASARETLAHAAAAGLAWEMVALEAGEVPDWEQAQRFVESLVLEEIEDDLIEQCGVDTRSQPQSTWLPAVKERLRSDLQQFRADVEGPHAQIEQWEFRDGRIFATVGSFADESDPDSPHGWMCRLVDASVLGAAGFERVRRPELLAVPGG